MRDTKIKLFYYSLDESQVKELELTRGKLIACIISSFLVLTCAAGLVLFLFTNFYHNIKIVSLTNLNNQLNDELSRMRQKIDYIESQIGQLEKIDNELRVIADLPQLDEDTRNVGTGGGIMNASYSMAYFSDEFSGQNVSLSYEDLLDQLERRIELTMESRDLIKQTLQKKKDKIKHTPSIRPLIGGMLRDKFGYRLDPFTEKIRHHDGIDIAAERGTEVFATAAGVVEKVVTRYKPGRGYGKQVIINHGYGIKTRYGHLSKILVREGQKVDRWTPIGLVGDTGRSTGPHLHYEVIQEGKETDPLKFILD